MELPLLKCRLLHYRSQTQSCAEIVAEERAAAQPRSHRPTKNSSVYPFLVPRAALFWCRVLYSLSTLPFLAFNVPAVRKVLTVGAHTVGHSDCRED